MHTHKYNRDSWLCPPHLPFSTPKEIKTHALLVHPLLSSQFFKQWTLIGEASIPIFHGKLMPLLVPSLIERNMFFFTVDTYSHFTWARAQTSENTKMLIHHIFFTFAIMDILQPINLIWALPSLSLYLKPSSTLTGKLPTIKGFPHNSQGYGIIERAQKPSKPNFLNNKKSPTPLMYS